MAGRRARSARRSSPRSQHFLRSPELAAELIRDAGIERDDLVLDLGAGRGRLTEQLARVAGRVLAVEIDPVLAQKLKGRWENVLVRTGDATCMALPEEPFRVVSNVPFHRTTDLMHMLLDDPQGELVRADLIVEWNVAIKRAIPCPSSLNSVFWGAYWEVSLARRIPRSAFSPAPSVDAGVLVLRRRARPLVALGAANEFRSFVAAAFRRGASHAPGLCGRHKPARARLARDLDAHEWASLFSARRG